LAFFSVIFATKAQMYAQLMPVFFNLSDAVEPYASVQWHMRGWSYGVSMDSFPSRAVTRTTSRQKWPIWNL